MALVLSWHGACTAAEVIQGQDGLRVEFSEQGRIERVDIGSTALPLKGTGGFSVADHQCPPPLVNLVPNAGFEEGLQGWKVEKGQTLDTAVAHSGRASIRLEVPGPQPGTTNLGVVIPVKPLDPKEVGRAFGEGLASAVFPPLDTVQSVLGTLEPCRAAYRQYLPAIEELSAAGWEPIPYASASEGVIVERFGSPNPGGLCFTLRNYADQPKQVALRLDHAGLKIPASVPLIAMDLVPGTPTIVPLQGDVLTARVEADNSRAFWIGSREQLAARGLCQAAAVVDKIERLFANELDPAAAQLLDQFRQKTAIGKARRRTVWLRRAAGRRRTMGRCRRPAWNWTSSSIRTPARIGGRELGQADGMQHG